MTEEALQLRKENQELREALKQTQELLRVALARIEELEKQKTPPPAFISFNDASPFSLNEDQARSRIEANISVMQKDDRGIWRGKATMKDGCCHPRFRRQ